MGKIYKIRADQMVKGKAKKTTSKKVTKASKNPLFEKRPRNFRIGGDIQPKKDLTRFVRWPKYVLLQRQKKVLLDRLKVPPAINQFSKTLDANQTKSLFNKYKPETAEEKKNRLLEQAKLKAANEQAKDSKKPCVLKYGLNHITSLIENKQAKLVIIAHDVDPIELVVCLPQLCRKQDVPFCFVKNKGRLGQLVNKKTATAVCLTQVRKEDAAELDLYVKNYRATYNENADLKKVWGGGKVGMKSTHQIEAKARALEKEEMKKAGY